jgi:hypothetical protein
MYTVTVKFADQVSIKPFDTFNDALNDACFASRLLGPYGGTSIQMADEDGKVIWSNKELEGEGGAVDGDRQADGGTEDRAGEDGL